MHLFRCALIVSFLSVGCEASIGAGGAASVSAGGPGGDATVVEPGPTPPVSGNGASFTLRPGVYKGDLVIAGNGNTVQGAGPGATTLDGRVLVTGNMNHVRGIRVLGATQVSGNGNSLEGNEYAGGEPQLVGNGNTR